jgi:hypothetical protein
VLLSLVVAARAIVHAGAGMPDGPMRTLTLAIGQATLRVAEVTHVTWPWDRLAAALGNAPQPAVPPLLASGSAAAAQPQVTPMPPAQTPQAGAGLIGAPPLLTGGRRTIQQPLADPPETQEPARHPTPTDVAREVRPVLEPKRNLRKGFRPWPTPPARTPPITILTVAPSTASATGRRRTVGAARPTRHRSAGRGRTATAHQDPLWRPTPSHPLRLLVTGDSLPGYLGPILLNDAAAIGPVRGAVDVHDGTGLTRPDFVDWSLVARGQVVTYHPDAVVVWMGGNDFQNMTLPTGHVFLAGTPAWTREYQRRAEICMRIWIHGGARRIYWLAMPPARDPSWAYDDAQINTALRRAAARVPGAEYLDILGPITNHGRYADYVHEHGQPELVREADGVHVNLAGSALVAREVLRVLEREWHLG